MANLKKLVTNFPGFFLLDGAAARAGVRQGDRIIKVNGTLVTGANHMDVVKMISCKQSFVCYAMKKSFSVDIRFEFAAGTYVALTLLGRPPSSSSASVGNSSFNVSTTAGQMTTVINAGTTTTTVNQPPNNTRHSIAHMMMHQQSADFPQPLSPNSTMITSCSSSVDSPSTSSSTVRRSITSVGEAKSKDFITGPQPVNVISFKFFSIAFFSQYLFISKHAIVFFLWKVFSWNIVLIFLGSDRPKSIAGKN